MGQNCCETMECFQLSNTKEMTITLKMKCGKILKIDKLSQNDLVKEVKW
jgi:hypothetical protein